MLQFLSCLKEKMCVQFKGSYCSWTKFLYLLKYTKSSLVPIIRVSIDTADVRVLLVTSKQFLPLQDSFTFHSPNW